MQLSIALIFVLILGAFIGYGAYSSNKWKKENPSNPTLEENRYFKAGLFYINPQDPRIFLNKRSGGGYTFNFGNPLTALFLLLMTGLGITFFYLS